MSAHSCYHVRPQQRLVGHAICSAQHSASPCIRRGHLCACPMTEGVLSLIVLLSYGCALAATRSSRSRARLRTSWRSGCCSLWTRAATCSAASSTASAGGKKKQAAWQTRAPVLFACMRPIQLHAAQHPSLLSWLCSLLLNTMLRCCVLACNAFCPQCSKETEDLARTLSQVRQPNGRLLTCK